VTTAGIHIQRFTAVKCFDKINDTVCPHETSFLWHPSIYLLSDFCENVQRFLMYSMPIHQGRRNGGE